jgi:hypothetical protein
VCGVQDRWSEKAAVMTRGSCCSCGRCCCCRGYLCFCHHCCCCCCCCWSPVCHPTHTHTPTSSALAMLVTPRPSTRSRSPVRVVRAAAQKMTCGVCAGVGSGWCGHVCAGGMQVVVVGGPSGNSTQHTAGAEAAAHPEQLQTHACEDDCSLVPHVARCHSGDRGPS